MSTTATSTVASSQPRAQPGSHTLLGDYVVLFKPRVSLMVIITAAAGFYLGSLASGISPFDFSLWRALFGIALVTTGSSALNQAVERSTDRRMPRTADRPMAQHRIGLIHGLLVGFVLVCGGTIYLTLATNPLTGLLTLLTAVGYIAIYTPLKRITTLNTFIGAFPGALPPLIGWTAARGVLEWPAAALFSILFLWQFPHFMAIGWLYRADYAHGGVRLASTQHPTSEAARSTALQAVFYALLIVPASLWPTWLHVTGILYAAAALVLDGFYLAAAIRFLRIMRCPDAPESRNLARRLLHVSVIYLPLLLLAMTLDARGRLLF